jgi:DNA-binding winged helix-turn-helix (wHTH) protein
MDIRPPALSATDLAVLNVLREHTGRIVGRATINRLAGLDHCTERRCDSAIVSLRRVLGQDAIVTVRRRGWMLTDACAGRVTELLGPAGESRDPSR